MHKDISKIFPIKSINGNICKTYDGKYFAVYEIYKEKITDDSFNLLCRSLEDTLSVLLLKNKFGYVKSDAYIKSKIQKISDKKYFRRALQELSDEKNILKESLFYTVYFSFSITKLDYLKEIEELMNKVGYRYVKLCEADMKNLLNNIWE